MISYSNLSIHNKKKLADLWRNLSINQPRNKKRQKLAPGQAPQQQQQLPRVARAKQEIHNAYHILVLNIPKNRKLTPKITLRARSQQRTNGVELNTSK